MANSAKPFCLLIISFISLASAGTTAQGQTPANGPVTSRTQALEAIEEAIFSRVNEYRRANGLPALSSSSELDAAAEQFARFLAESGRVEHDADGRSPAERATESGYQFCSIRENLAYLGGFSIEDVNELSRQFVQGWIDSDGHRKNMLAEQIPDTGIAVATDDEVEFYAVQMFGKSQSQLFEVELTNRTNRAQKVTVEQTEEADSIDLQPMARFTLQTCTPLTLILDSTQQGVPVDDASRLEIVPGTDNEAELQKAENSYTNRV